MYTALFRGVFLFWYCKNYRLFFSNKQVTQHVPVELTLPVFDQRVYCKEIAASVMPDMKKEVYQRCLYLESEAYFAIREMWDTLSDTSKKRCMKMVRPGDGNYFLLQDCLLNEKDGEKIRCATTFKFSRKNLKGGKLHEKKIKAVLLLQKNV